ncbi:MAG: lipid-A-disaccharide synthase N-terminal domain-containing protein [Candidatus Kaistia colombiensis]|nr:MAG: lipid-A-disaccharide synthase N-terminal domain-containing protein [Kaistia sp.]
MAGDLLGAIGNWLHHVFVEQFDVWILLGFAAQALFTMRFVVQWIASERAKKSVVPAAFWTFSILGGALLLIYAIYRKDPVFIAGQAAGLFIYFRNVWFILHERKQTRESRAVS